MVSFVVPEFDYPNTPANANEIQYKLELVDKNFTFFWAFKPENMNISGANITERFDLTDSGYNAYNLTSHYYQLSIVWIGSSSPSNKFVSTSRECDIITKSPTNSPTIEPTHYPTVSPTYHPPGVYLADDVCSDVERCECNGNFDFSCTANGGRASPPLSFDESTFAKEHFEIKRFPENYDHKIEIFWVFIPSNNNGSVGATNQDIQPWNGSVILDIDEDSHWITTQFVLENDELDTDAGSERFELWLTGCIVVENYDNEEEEEGLQNCSVIYPAMTPVIISDTASSSLSTFEELGELPDFVWVLLLGGAAGFGAVGWLYYTRTKNLKMANESAMQDIQPVSLMQGNVAGDLDANAQVQFPA